MGRLRRLDSELVRRKLADSRTRAAELIRAGVVYVDGEPVLKPARQLDPAQAVVVKDEYDPGYASRGAWKLRGALDILKELLGDAAPKVSGRVCLDAGASTGGFTDVLLREGAEKIYAIDVGYGQLIWRLRSDLHVEVHDRTNIRYLTAGDLEPAPTLIVSDLSFISLTLVIPALVEVAAPAAEYLLMVKPQFEVGRENVGRGGVVTDPAQHAAAVTKVADCALDNGLEVLQMAESVLPGPAGNIEYFLYLRKGDLLGRDVPKGANPMTDSEITARIGEMVAMRPTGSLGGRR